MRGIGMWDSSSISTLFSGFSSSRSSNAASSFIANMDMTTYSGIRSGSYFKLLKSYYGNNLNSKAQSLVSSSVSTSKDSAKTLASIESESEDMVKSAQALYKNSRKDDTDATYKKVSAFVSDYNSLINAADDSETKQISRNLESMKSLTDINSKLLAKVGITVDSKSGKLSVDEDTFKKADSTKVDALFLRGMALMLTQWQARLQCLSMPQRMRQKKTNTYGANGRYTQAYNSGYNYNMFL